MESKILRSLEKNPFGIELVFIDYINYFNSIEEALLDKKQSFEIDVYINRDAREKAIQNNDYAKEALQFMGQQISEQFMFLSVTYPNYFRSFFLTQLYAFIENELKVICEQHSIINDILWMPKSPKNRESELQRIKNYLLNSFNINENRITEEFEILERVRRIRNVIIHSNGILLKGQKELDYFLDMSNKTKLIKMIQSSSDSYQIVLENREMIVTLAKAGENLFAKLLRDERRILP